MDSRNATEEKEMRTKDQVQELVIEVSCRHIEGLDPDKVDANSHYKTDLAADSGEIENARQELEQTLGVKATDDEVKASLTVGKITELYFSKLSEGAPVEATVEA